MELDSLKYVWRSLETRPIPERSPDEIRSIMEQRSRGPLAAMRRNLVGELLLIFATYTPAIFFYFLEFEGRLAGVAWLVLLLLAFLAAYFYRKNRLLKAMQCADADLRTSLSRQLRTLRSYTRFYTWAGTAMIPIMTILTWLIIRWQFPPIPGADLFYKLSGAPWWRKPEYWMLLLMPVTIGMYFINAWYVGRLYGQHIRKLQDLHEEMEEL